MDNEPTAVGLESWVRIAARQHSIPRVHELWKELLADPEVQVVDIAVPPHAQPEIIEACIEHAGKIRGILAQRPLALSYAEAARLVKLCKDAGIVLAVNQNMRYDQSARALKDLLGRGLLGDPFLCPLDSEHLGRENRTKVSIQEETVKH